MNGKSWPELGLQPQLCEALEANGIQRPTEVQADAIPALLAGRDVTARSQTGTGKTLAFLLPLLQRINADSGAIQAVVISPTQELAMQIVRVAEVYAESLGIRVQQLIGGAAMKRQVEKLKLRPQLVIGTPGRIHELLKLRKLKLGEVRSVVIDEADQTFQLGSAQELETVLFAMGKERQVAFFSATYPDIMVRFEGRWMNEPVRVQLSPQHRVSETVGNFYIVSDKRDKPDTARRLIRLLDPKSALLFLNDTNEIANWEAKLRYEGFAVEALYGDADKQRRAATLARFRDGRCQLLLATDVAARGLDIEGLPLVLQLDPAIDADHYVHRAGRTGRMGRNGMVMTIVTPQELFIMDKFRKALGIDLREQALYRGKLLPAEESREAARPGGHRGERGSKRDGVAAADVRNGGGRGKNGAGAESSAGNGKNGVGAESGAGNGQTGASVRNGAANGKMEARVRSGTGRNGAGTRDASGMGEGAGPSAGRRGVGSIGAGAQRGSNGDAGVRQAKKQGAAPIPAKIKSDRKRDGKNKGAPKWLKEKRQANKTEQ